MYVEHVSVHGGADIEKPATPLSAFTPSHFHIFAFTGHVILVFRWIN
jgi:hypothetical protein